jgi:hypothetical protein
LRWLVLFFLFTPLSYAYVRTMSDSGIPLRWPSPNIVFKGNGINANSLTNGEIENIFSTSIGSWLAGGSAVSASFQRTDSAPSQGAFDGINTVYFASAANLRIDPSVIAITEVTYYLSNGNIAEADLIFNDIGFMFTSNLGDTGKSLNGKRLIYLADVATHEFGHAFGLDHSSVNLSSMIYTAFSGQSRLSNDDNIGLKTLYPNGGNYGSIRGSIEGRNGGIFGSHVLAIELSSGKVMASTLSNPDGSFQIFDIPAGNYAVFLEPYLADISSISSYFQNVNHRFCGGNRYKRRFYSACGSNTPSVIKVSNSSSTNIGTLAPSCSSMGNPSGSPLTINTSLPISELGQLKFGTLRPGESHYYRVQNVSGDLQARIQTYSLYSPIDAKVEFLDENGDPLHGSTSIDNIEDPMPGGYVQYDSLASATQIPNGNYLIKITGAPQRLYSSVYPAGFAYLDGEGHYLLSFSVNGSFGNPTTTDMSSCVSVNNSQQSASYRAPASNNRETTSDSGCGSIDSSGSPWSGGIAQALFTILFLHLFFRSFLSLLEKRKR